MKVILKNDLIKAIGFKPLKQFIPKYEKEEDYIRWYRDLSIDLIHLKDEDCKKIITIIQKHLDIRGTKTAIRDINTWLDLKNKKLRVVKRVRDFDSVLTQYLHDIDGHRIFAKDSFDPDALLCYRVTEIKYHEKETHQYTTTPEHVTMDIAYKRFGIEREQTVTFWREDITNKNPQEILMLKGFEVERPELRQQYLNDVKTYYNIKDRIGKQYLANGAGLDDVLDDDDDDYRRYKHMSKGKSFVFKEHKVVVDVFIENEAKYEELRHSNHIEDGAWWWSRVGGKVGLNDDEDEGDELEYPPEEQNVELPTHPHVVIFDLVRHLRLTTHVNFLTEYIYDDKMADKLIINEEVKQLIETLVSNKSSNFQDIVKGKSGGTVMLLTGNAGVGKTLTAEVFAEYQKKPLYNVQASQLGLNPEELEGELKKVLQRSARWNAILLIDEADVYVHQRGNDLMQNAIVGVFLRILEYHDATVFLTTNRPDIVDDAIISRCIAKIDYKYPTKEQQIEIWNIISKNSNVVIPNEIINEFVSRHHNYSGRDIKNLIKLSNLKSLADKKPIDVKLIEFISLFNPSLVNNKTMEKKID